jgi:hypothetical protein
MQDREMQRPANGSVVGRRVNVGGLCFCLWLTSGCTAAIPQTRQHKQRNLSPWPSPERSGLSNLPHLSSPADCSTFSDWPDSQAASQREGWAWARRGPGVGQAWARQS